MRFERRLLVQPVFRKLRVEFRVVVARVLDNAFAHLEGQVQAGKLRVLLLEGFDDAHGVQVVVKAVVIAFHEPAQDGFARVAEGRMPHVVHQRQRFHQVGIEAKRLRHGAADLGHLERVRQSRAEMVGVPARKNLRLVFQAPEGARVDDAVAVAHVFVPVRMTRLRVTPAEGLFDGHGVARKVVWARVTHGRVPLTIARP